MGDLISRQAAIDRAVSIPMFGRDIKMVAVSEIENLPSAQPDVTDIDDGDMISRQAAIEALDEIEAEVADGYGYQYAKWREYFVEMPSARPEQITCKDCNHCTFNAGAKIYCDELDMRMYQWDYCSRAERRES